MSRKKQYYKSVVMLEWCLRLDSEHPNVVNNLSYVYILLRKNKEASEICSAAYRENRGPSNYFRNWAISLLNQRYYSEAVDVIKCAIEEDAKCASKGGVTVENWVVWAEVMKSKGEFETAKLLYSRAIKIEGCDPYARAELTKLNAITNEKVARGLDELLLEIANQKALAEQNQE